MKLFNSVLVLLSLTAVAAAQSAPPSQVVAPKPAAGTSQAKSPFTAKKKPEAKKEAAPASAKKESATAIAAKAGANGRRDPFINPVVKAVGGGQSVPCNTGKRCLAIHDMVLRGVVKGQSGMIAVVENNAHKTYFLRENDPVFNGTVVKITGDSVIFRENTQDSAGHPSSHEVVKTLVPQA